MKMLLGASVLLALLGLLSLHCVEGQQYHSVCRSPAYRRLSIGLQNEHQCIVIEKLQEDFEQGAMTQADQFDNLFRMMTTLNERLRKGLFTLTRSRTRDQVRSRPALIDIPLARDCQELHQSGTTVSGIYPIQLPTRRLVNVRCDMDTSNGGWTLIQRRVDGSVNFTRNWVHYAFGFGNVNTEYWLGNEHLHLMTTTQKYSIRIDLWDWDDTHVYALYDNFHVGHEHTLYQLHIQNYTGTAGDAMGPYHDGLRFSTIDSDNDQWHASCAQIDQSGWWFRGCGYASLNGMHSDNRTAEMSPEGPIQGLVWYDWEKDFKYSVKKTEMKIKPLTSILYEREQEQLLKEGTTTVATPSTVPPTMTASITTVTPTSTSAIPTTIASSTTITNENKLDPNDKDHAEQDENVREEMDFLEAARMKLTQKLERFKILNKKDESVTLATQVPMTTSVAMTTTVDNDGQQNGESKDPNQNDEEIPSL